MEKNIGKSTNSNYLNTKRHSTTTSSTPKMTFTKKERNPLYDKAYTLDYNIPVKPGKDFLQKVKYLCNSISSVEWSGVLFYSFKGSLHDKTMEIELVDIFPMDKGSSTATHFDYTDPAYLQFMANNIDLFSTCRTGLIHSHWDMNSYFSNTDDEELIDNAASYPMYLSVVVNNKMDIVAKLAQQVTYNLPPYSYVAKDENGRNKVIEFEGKQEERILFYTCDVIQEKPVFKVEKIFSDRVTEIIEKSKKKLPVYTTGPFNYEIDFPSNTDFSDSLDILDICTFMSGTYDIRQTLQSVCAEFKYNEREHGPELFIFEYEQKYPNLGIDELLQQVIDEVSNYDIYEEVKTFIESFEEFKTP